MKKPPNRTLKQKVESVQVNPEAFEEAGIPLKFRNLDITTYAGSPEALKIVKKYTNNLKTYRKTGLGLYFNGPRDSCKTTLAVYAAIVALTEGFTVRYVSMPELVDQIFNKELNTGDLIAPDFLIVDNLTLESNSFWQTLLQRILIARKDAGKPVMFVSALDEKQFTATYGETSRQRIEEVCQLVPCFIDPAKRDEFLSELHWDFYESDSGETEI